MIYTYLYYIISNPISLIDYYLLSLKIVSLKPSLKYSTINMTQTEIHVTPHYIKSILRVEQWSYQLYCVYLLLR